MKKHWLFSVFLVNTHFIFSIPQDAIHRVKKHFNKEFESVYEKKEQEIGKIREKNKRIRKIMEDLDITQDVGDPELSIIEKPEKLLVVEDSEVRLFCAQKC